MSFSRRDWLIGAGGLGLSWAVPRAEDGPGPASEGGPLFVLLDLAGGNDGLNTLVPKRDDDYYRARGGLAIPAGATLALDDEQGLHPALPFLRSLHEEGQLAHVHGVAPTRPDRSHFFAIDVRDTGGDGTRWITSGWLGRLLARSGAARAVNLGDRPSLAFRSPGGESRAVTFHDPEQFRSLAEVAHPALAGLFRAWNAPRETPARTPVACELAHLAALADESLRLAQEVRATKGVRLVGDYGVGVLARDLRTAARLIGSGFPARVYRLQHGSFDTHAEQAKDEGRLYASLDQALAGFVTDLRAQGNWKRLVLATTSEFGRRLKCNGSRGTDHGIASVQLVLGGRVRGGGYGRRPSLAPDALLDGNPAPTTDYRAVFATILERHLGQPAGEVFDAELDRLEFLPPA